MNEYDCLLFDFDGTLADTTEGILRTEEAMLRQMGLPQGTRAQMRQGIGLPLKDSLKVGCLIEEKLLDQAVATYRALFDQIAYDYIVPYPGVKDTLKYLSIKGYRMGVVTSRSGRSLFRLLDQLEIAQYFLEVATVESTEKHKPEPEPALFVMEKMKVSGDDCLIVGDTSYDLLMGRRAGCHTCGVSYGNHTAERLASVEPDYILASFSELCNIL